MRRCLLAVAVFSLGARLATAAAPGAGRGASSAGTHAATTPATVQATTTSPAELAVRGAAIVTMDAAMPMATALAVRDGLIVYVGDDAGLAAYLGPRTRVIAGGNMTVLPGLTDAHAHLVGLGLSLVKLELRGETSAAAIIAKVQQAVQSSTEKGSTTWLLGRGWDQNLWSSKELPGRAELAALDAASSSRPVLLRRIDGHAAWVNSEALRRAGISATDCKDQGPPGGRILRGEKCQPTGVLVDNAMALVEKLLPSPSHDQIETAILKAAAHVTSRGLTAVHEMGIDSDEVAVYRKLAQAGRLPLRVFAYHSDPMPTALAQLPHSQAYRAELDRLRERLGPPETSPMFSLRGIKLYMDGALGSRGAALEAPYSDEPKSSGLTLCAPEHIEQMARWAGLYGYQIATHAIGDRAVHLVLDAYERAGVRAARNRRFRIEHTQVVLPSELSRRRFAELGVIASVQPQHAVSDMPWAEARLGGERIKYAYAYKSLLRSGARLAGGSDFPVEEADPRLILHAAVTRRDVNGNPPTGYFPEQRLTVGEAIRIMTSDAAYAAFAEDQLGKLSAGKAADLTMLAGTLRPFDDPQGTPPDDLYRRDVLLTVVAGHVVYDGLAKDSATDKSGSSKKK